ncbi:MAG: hypothetical protein ACFE85_06795 [Candidatus Hodarchaeota archaeon]
MGKDALKFFHAYINEMIDVGGENLPRAVSTKLGGKLGSLYRKRGVTDLEIALKQIYKVLGAKTKIKKINGNIYDVKIKHSKRFCPIGGKSNPKQAKIIQDNICYPYTKSFLKTLFPNWIFEADIKHCIVANSINSYCHYTLDIKEENKLK